jgi:hypothetical protein
MDERKQMPQVVENAENECSGWNAWKGRLFARGRYATRLRYAPTAKHPIVRQLRRRYRYWKYGFTPGGSGVLSSATIIDEI